MLIVDPRDVVINVLERNDGRVLLADVFGLTEGERVVRVLWEFDAQATNGGIEQYLWNSTGENAGLLLRSLEMVGSHAVSDIVRDALCVLPASIDWRDFRARRDCLDKLPSEYMARLDRLSDDYDRCAENVVDLLATFIESRPVEFGILRH